MSEIPADVYAHYESLVVSRLAAGKVLKKQLTPLMAKLRAGEIPSDDPEKLVLIGESVEALLKAVSRNTSPFYERQTFALVTMFMEIESPRSFVAGLSLDMLEALTNRTAITVHKQWLSVGSSGVKPRS